MSSGYYVHPGPAPTPSHTRNRASSVPRPSMIYRTSIEQPTAPIVNNDDSRRHPLLRKSQKKPELTPAEQYKRSVLAAEGGSQNPPVPPPKQYLHPSQTAQNVERIGRPRQHTRPEILQPATFTEPPLSTSRQRRETSVHNEPQPSRHHRGSSAPLEAQLAQQPHHRRNASGNPQQMQAMGYNSSFDSIQQGQGTNLIRNRTVPTNPTAAPNHLVHRRVTNPTSPQGFPAMGHSGDPSGRRGRSEAPRQPVVTQESPTSSYTSAGTSHYAPSQTMPPTRNYKGEASRSRSLISFGSRRRANSDSQGVRPPVHDLRGGLTPTTTRSGWPSLGASTGEKSSKDDSTSSVFGRVRKLSTGSIRSVFPCLMPDTVENYEEPITPAKKFFLPSPPSSATSHESMAQKRLRRMSPGVFAENLVLKGLKDIDLPARRPVQYYEPGIQIENFRFRESRPMPMHFNEKRR